eukprot:TRINITY_DN5473_c1_g1_i1.p1 TRINITY_DN5473_c1_g1~~TRINITY_DN5473_c1_g1_i1.p1  ORF type:complete len:406 (+),score=23.83 TRINITY_DN5473_c1_g1_i1:48-1220(+)
MRFVHLLLLGLFVGLLMWLKDILNLNKRGSTTTKHTLEVRIVEVEAERGFPVYDIKERRYKYPRLVSVGNPYNNVTGTYFRVVPGNYTEEEFFTYKQSQLPKAECPDGRLVYDRSRLLFHDEFGIELIIMLSFAHWLHMNCYEVHTISTVGTEPLYYFSDSHTIIDVPRQSIPDNYSCCPLNTIHVPQLPEKFWSPNYKELYHNRLLVFEKPLLLISNKYQREWNKNPVNYLPTGVLVTLLELLTPHYTVVYNRPTGTIVLDGSEVFDLQEKQAVKQHGGILFEDLQEKTELQVGSEIPFNLFQMWVYANAVNYIAVQGGNSIFAAHLAGKGAKVAVLLKQGREIHVNSMNVWYSRFSGANVTSFTRSESLIDFVASSFIPAPDYPSGRP